MSRIHDALRRVDEQRLAAEQTKNLSPEDDGRGLHTRPEASPEYPAKLEPADAGPARPAALLDAFAEQCQVSEWVPDPGVILFYGEEFRTPGSEEFRTLRSRLDLVRDRQPLRTLLITSPMPGEGKTFVSANLAQVIVWQPERHVLLIDGDLRSSTLHTALGVPSTPGLSDYLHGDVDEVAVVRRGPLPNFFFISGGTPMPNASELIANGRLRTLLRRLGTAFDWIIIDSPPVIPVADARLMAECCDGVLLVVKAEQTPGDLAQIAYREFRGKPFVGVVFNSMNPDSAYGYKYPYPREKSAAKAGFFSSVLRRHGRPRSH